MAAAATGTAGAGGVFLAISCGSLRAPTTVGAATGAAGAGGG